jgi:glutamate racemase
METKTALPKNPGPIGIFDSGYGGLTILEKIREQMPGYDYIYLGDNARTPYGTRSFDVVYKYTLECVTRLFEMGCHLVVLACNTASAKALRSIQQRDLPTVANKPICPVCVIAPTASTVGRITPKTRREGSSAGRSRC